MAKGDLFCIRTNNGYGLFQEYDCLSDSKFRDPFYIIYYTQIRHIADAEILSALNGEYYYSRIRLEEPILSGGFILEKLLSNKNVEFSAEYWGAEKDPYYGDCYITYLGSFSIPTSAKIPNYSRLLNLSKFTGKHKWYIQNEKDSQLLRNDKDRLVTYKTLNTEISQYPRSLVIHPTEIVKRFDANYTQSNDDNWIDMEMEEFYQENPDMRPIKLKYEEVKFPLPTEEFRRLNKIEDEDNNQADYDRFCDKIEELCLTFLNGIDEDKKSTKKCLLALIKGLNILEEETGLLDTLEAELIYDYIVKVLKSLRKISLIEILEDKREW